MRGEHEISVGGVEELAEECRSLAIQRPKDVEFVNKEDDVKVAEVVEEGLLIYHNRLPCRRLRVEQLTSDLPPNGLHG